MEAGVFRNLMRTFFQYQADALLCVQQSQIVGVIHKRVIEELMSDLSHADTIREIPMHMIHSRDEAHELFLRHGIEVNERKVLPVVDTGGIFTALWTKKEILQTSIAGHENGEDADPVTEKTLAEEKFTKELVDEILKPATVAPVKPEIRFQIATALENNVKNIARDNSPEKSGFEKSSNVNEKNSRFHDADYVSIKTLEALPIPMLALDTRGEVLFYNQDWVKLQQQNRETLGVKRLMRVTRDIMAKMAFDGNLEIDSVLNLPDSPPGYLLQMKSILGDDEPRARVIGYIFWIEHASRPAPPGHTPQATADAPQKKKSPAQTGPDYSGKTLVELLEAEEKKIIQWAMEHTGHNQSNAAMLLGIPRQTFSYRYHRLFDEKPSGKSSGKRPPKKK